jgi:hypothetical protein
VLSLGFPTAKAKFPAVTNPDTGSYPGICKGPLGIDTSFIDCTTQLVSIV